MWIRDATNIIEPLGKLVEDLRLVKGEEDFKSPKELLSTVPKRSTFGPPPSKRKVQRYVPITSSPPSPTPPAPEKEEGGKVKQRKVEVEEPLDETRSRPNTRRTKVAPRKSSPSTSRSPSPVRSRHLQKSLSRREKQESYDSDSSSSSSSDSSSDSENEARNPKKKKVEVDLVSSNDESSDTDNEDQDDELAFGKPYPYEKKIVTIPPPFSIIEVDPMKNGKQKIAGGNTTFDLMTSGHWKISGGPLRLNNSEILELRKQIGGDNPLYAIKKFDIETKFFNLVHIDKSPTNKIVEETLKRELSILEACFIFHDRISTHVLAIARQATSQNKKNRKSRKGQYVSEEDELLLRTFFDLISKYRTIKDGKKTK
jgi:hypothetical protein